MTNADTNYTSIQTCAATGGNVAVRLDCALPPPDATQRLGPNTSWDQRRAFEWAYLAHCFFRAQDQTQEAYCNQRVRELIDQDVADR